MIRLRTEKEIINGWHGDIDKLKVSICCITYNHELYIEDALNGFLMQETNFPFEILIHDDASPDRTIKVIQKYHEKYPNIIKPMYQTENQYSKGGVHPNLDFNYPRAKGEYIALCDGDDYWTDPHKLNKQITFLGENPNFIGTAHNVRVINENGEKVDSQKAYPYKKLPAHIFTLKEAEKFKLAGQTSSIIYRNIWGEMEKDRLWLFKTCKTTGDKKLALLMALLGNVYYFSDTMADHRKITTGGTSWSAKSFGKNMALHRYKELISVNEFAYKSFGISLDNKRQRLDSFYNGVVFFIKNPSKYNWQIIGEILKLDYDKKRKLIFHIPYNLLTWPLRRIKRGFVHVK